MAVAAILDFQKFKFLPADTLGGPNLRKPAKFHQDRPIRCWDMANFRFFKMAAVRHVGFLKLQFWIFSGIRSANARHHVKFCEIRLNGCGDIAILPFSKMAVAAILDFQKFKFFPAGTLGRPNLRKPAKFHRPIRCWDMENFRFSKMAAVLHFGFVVRVFGPPTKSTWWPLSLCKKLLESMHWFR